MSDERGSSWSMDLEGLVVLVTGGTGSLGNAIVRRIMSGRMGRPRKVLVFSRDELKQHEMRVRWHQTRTPMEDIRDVSAKETLEFHIGDVRLLDTLMPVLRRADVVVNAAALKQVPQCEYFPIEAVRTNVLGAYELVRGIREHQLPVRRVVSISTDKACKPVNVMGMSKALQERVMVAANLDCPGTEFVVVRFGNVLATRGSVVPHFREQIEAGGPLTVTSAEMTRFLLTLDQAVDTVFEAMRHALPGETLIPRVPSARVVDIAKVMIGSKPIDIEVIGIRPGEKIHEILVSEEEWGRTTERNGYFMIRSMLAEGGEESSGNRDRREYSSSEGLLSRDEIAVLLRASGFDLEVERRLSRV